MNRYVSSCGDCTNDACLIFRYKKEEGLSEPISRRRTFNCRKGQDFIMEGAPVNGLYFVLEGKVKVFMTGFAGKKQIIRLAGPGEIIGHRGFGTRDVYQITATTLDDAVLCHFTSEDFQEMLQLHPQLTFDLMHLYAKELDKSETKIKQFSQMTVRERVIDSLLYILRKFKEKAGYLQVTLSRQELADLAGTTDEQVTRVLSALKKEGLIHLSGKRIALKQVEILKEEISSHFFIGS